MPGPFTHIYTARRVADFLATGVTPDFIRNIDDALQRVQQLEPNLVATLGPETCALAMQHWPKFTSVGALGPDLFFFLQDYNIQDLPCDEIMLAMNLLYYLDDQGRLPDPPGAYDGLLTIVSEVNDTWGKILRFIVKLDTIWKNFLKVWDATIGAILAKAGQVIDDLTGGLFSALGDAFTQLKNDILTLIEEELLTEGDIFGWFSLKMRDGFDARSFLWSDMTHYRRTSIIPARLIAHARPMLASMDTVMREHGEQLLAFALGWACHVGTDVIAHSFVNEQCGGPFRTHWQRHHLIENHIDAWNYQCTVNGLLPPDDFVGFKATYPSLADSALYFSVQIPQGIDTLPQAAKQGDARVPLPAATDQPSRDQRATLLNTDGELPLWLAEVIVQVFIEVYADPATEGGNKDVQSALKEGAAPPHPRNLQGQAFQDALHTGTAFAGLITKWAGKLGVNNVGIALDDLLKVIAPDPPASYPKGVPEGFPFPWEVQSAYRFMLSWFKRQYVATTDMDRPEPPTVFTPPASDFNFGPPDFSGANASDNPASNACSDILALLDFLFKTLEQIAQILYDIAKSAASAATWPAREVLYAAVTLPAWQAAENMRMVLIHLGYIQPQSEQFYLDGNLRRPNEIDEVLIRLGHSVNSAFQQALADAWDPLANLDHDPSLNNVGVREVLGALNPWLPVRLTRGQPLPNKIQSIFSGNDVIEYTRPWAFPDRTNDSNPALAGNYIESPATTAGPYLTDTMPHQMLRTDALASNRVRVLYEAAQCPEQTDKFNLAFVVDGARGGVGRLNGTNPLGDPIVFSAYLIGQLANNPSFSASYNLDADRAYGYLCWDWVRGDMPPPNATQPTDGRGRLFPPPKHWPEGAAGAIPGEPGEPGDTPKAQGDPTADPTHEFWRRPKPVPVGSDLLYGLAMLLEYPGRKCPVNDRILQTPARELK